MFISIKNDEYIKEQKLVALAYQMPQEDREEMARIIRDFSYSYTLKNTPKWYFNDKNVEDREKLDLKNVNAYIPPRSKNPDESWRAQTVRPTTRQKVITIAAKITTSILAPHCFAYNESNDVDQDAAVVMEQLMQWVTDNSNYREAFFNAIYGALVSPISYVYEEYINGEFRFQNVPLGEVFLANDYIYNIQEQPFLFRTRDIDWVTAKQKWGKEDNFQYVKPGVQPVFQETTGMLYQENKPPVNDRLVNETIYWNKNEKIIIVYLNGVLIKKMPMVRYKYPFVTLGYELIDNGNVSYFKSLVFKLEPAQKVLDEMYRLALDGTLLANMPPTALYGELAIDTGVIAPGRVVPLADPNARLEAFMPRGDLGANWNAIDRIEVDMSGSAQSDTATSSPNMTAYQTAVLEEQNKIQLGLFGKMVNNFVVDLGELIVDDILRHLTVKQVMDIAGDDVLKYKSFLIGDTENKKNTKIEFWEGLQNEMTPQELEMEKLALLTQEAKTNQTIYRVNPSYFKKLKYKLRISADTIFAPSGGVLKAFNLEGYDRMVNNPLIAGDLESLANVTRDMLVAQYKPNAVDKYVPGKNKVDDMLSEQQQAKQMAQQQAEVQLQQGNGQPVEEREPAIPVRPEKQKEQSLNKSVGKIA